eukprot:CAMPEP_0201616084 /NCGR_PEP_ID=MMETSP0492-20130828/33021_1 /ASSEMBLY_ACC=CAM_ASM_000837 /TAXON_ID=420259 /ORGANISM="Thalassiosira gravida, Strain GMp14c1" /LENGTH=156 /DNA_ID=CAMNT_0048083941 /DNA_START=124 /DNA_END=591 /DNA_ORIENTATION=+
MMDSDSENFLSYMCAQPDHPRAHRRRHHPRHRLRQRRPGNSVTASTKTETKTIACDCKIPSARISLKEIKMECKSNSSPVSGNKKVLVLKLAFKKLPADVGESLSTGYRITRNILNKRGGKRVRMGSVATGAGVATTKKRKTEGAKNFAKAVKEVF